MARGGAARCDLSSLAAVRAALTLAIGLVALTAAPAAAWEEVPFRALPGRTAATCVRAAGADGSLAALGRAECARRQWTSSPPHRNRLPCVIARASSACSTARRCTGTAIWRWRPCPNRGSPAASSWPSRSEIPAAPSDRPHDSVAPPCRAAPTTRGSPRAARRSSLGSSGLRARRVQRLPDDDQTVRLRVRCSAACDLRAYLRTRERLVAVTGATFSAAGTHTLVITPEIGTFAARRPRAALRVRVSAPGSPVARTQRLPLRLVRRN